MSPYGWSIMSPDRSVVRMPKQRDQSLDAGVPELLVLAEPGVGAGQRARVDAKVMNPAAHRALHQAGALESLDVLGRRCERHTMGCCEIGHRLLSPDEPLEHRTASVISQGAKNHVELSATLLNHMVEYSRWSSAGQPVPAEASLDRHRPCSFPP